MNFYGGSEISRIVWVVRSIPSKNAVYPTSLVRTDAPDGEIVLVLRFVSLSQCQGETDTIGDVTLSPPPRAEGAEQERDGVDLTKLNISKAAPKMT